MPHYTRLREFRRLKGKTQEQVAGELGINKKTLSTYETGRTGLSAETLLLFADYYGCTTDEILGHGESHSPGDVFLSVTEAEETYVKLFRKLPPNHRQSIIDLMRGCTKSGR